MTLGFTSFGSSSSGNCYLVRSETANILVDVGLPAVQICRGLAAHGLTPEDIDAVLLTHEHIDHVRSVSAFHKKAPQAQFFASGGTAAALSSAAAAAVDGCLTCLQRQPAYPVFTVGDITVACAALSHDAAEPVTYTFAKDGKKIAIVTDTGYIPEPLYEAVSDADLLVLEANHETNILLYGRYPYPVKRRILSDVGHLSNEAAGQCLCRMLAARNGQPALRVFLAHLSRENNTPEQAFLTVRNMLEEGSFYVGSDVSVDVLAPDGLDRMVEL